MKYTRIQEVFQVHNTFSLVDIHTSNWAEPSIRKVLRYLKQFVFDINSRQLWHQHEFLQAVAAIKNNHVNCMIGFSSNQVRYGNGLHKHFKIADRALSTDMHTCIQQLDAMLHVCTNERCTNS